jgi:hypothetical protein
MKKLILILFLLFAFNFYSPGNINIYIRQRHTIEYARRLNKRELDIEDLMRDKVMIYIRLEILKLRMLRYEAVQIYNTT